MDPTGTDPCRREDGEDAFPSSVRDSGRGVGSGGEGGSLVRQTKGPRWFRERPLPSPVLVGVGGSGDTDSGGRVGFDAGSLRSLLRDSWKEMITSPHPGRGEESGDWTLSSGRGHFTEIRDSYEKYSEPHRVPFFGHFRGPLFYVSSHSVD